jgi:hypothetical protein
MLEGYPVLQTLKELAGMVEGTLKLFERRFGASVVSAEP